MFERSGMYERFTDRTRRVMVLANVEAHRLNHEFIGTEHILLGLIKEGAGVAAHVLMHLGVDLAKARAEVERFVLRGPDMVKKVTLPETPQAIQVIAYAMKEAHALNHNYVGTEHLLLGLLREEEGIAAQVLINFGLKLNSVRLEVLNLLGHGLDSPAPAPQITKPQSVEASLVAVDIGNSGIKLGQFARNNTSGPTDRHSLPEPRETLELPIEHETGQCDFSALATWCELHLSPSIHWSIGSVHRSADELLAATITTWAKHLNFDWPIRRLTYKDIPIPIRVEEPARGGIDRLLAAVAANRLRTPDRSAIVVDLGTAITVDLVEADGAFAGGAILPGIGMAGRALMEQTEALPHVVLEHSETPPTPLGKSTKAAIEAGLHWGTVGAVGELASRLAADLPTQPDFFITGGASRTVANSMKGIGRVQYVPHLVLAGIALVEEQAPGGSRGSTG